MVITSFRNGSRKRFWREDDESGVNPEHIDRIDEILTSIEASHNPQDLASVFGRKFGKKKGRAQNVYAIWVNGQWRITFEIEDDGAILLDYVDYHGKGIRAK